MSGPFAVAVFAAGDGGGLGDYAGELFVLGGIALTALLGWVGTVIAKRVRGRATEPEMWARLEATERRDVVKGYIIRSLVRQWPKGSIPHLDPGYLSELDEDTLPLDHEWRTHP